MDYSALRKDILAENNNTLYIRQESETDILTDDVVECKYISYHLAPVTGAWLRSRFLWAASCKELQSRYEAVCVSLLMSVDPNMLINLNRIIFVADVSDIKNVCEEMDIEEWEFPDRIRFDDDDPIGLYWCAENSIIVNWAAIRNSAADIALDTSEIPTEEDIGVLTTIAHEVRHLGMANPFLPEDKYSNSECTEDAVEAWGLNAYESWKFHC